MIDELDFFLFLVCWMDLENESFEATMVKKIAVALKGQTQS
jgi:hypothetical protein